MAAPFGDPYMVRVSGDFLPKLCVLTSARMSVCKLRLQFVERGVGERKLMNSRCRTFYDEARLGRARTDFRDGGGGSARCGCSRVPGAGIHFTLWAAEAHIAREIAVTE